MYQPYPGGATPPEAYGQSPTSVPQSITRAVRVMYAGAAASLIGIAVNLTTSGSLRSDIRARRPSLTPAQLTTAVHAEIGFAIAGGLIGAALWIWMAQRSKAGKGWARIASTVLFAIDTISALVSASGAGSLSVGGATRAYAIVVWLIGLVAIVFLWQRSSSAYFKRAPRY
jgi:hypothetical protein